jgi:hypothetical protein
MKFVYSFHHPLQDFFWLILSLPKIKLRCLLKCKSSVINNTNGFPSLLYKRSGFFPSVIDQSKSFIWDVNVELKFKLESKGATQRIC